jgi:hypothetical protein
MQLGLLDLFAQRVNGRPVVENAMAYLGGATVLYLAYRGALVVYKELR